MSANDRNDTTGVEHRETDRLIASDRVEGTDVYNRAGEHLGTVMNFMVDKFTGKVAYAVMSFGGFLGIGERYHTLPWEKLDYDTGRRGFVVDIDRAQLAGAPQHGPQDDPWRDPAYPRDIHAYYGVPFSI